MVHRHFHSAPPTIKKLPTALSCVRSRIYYKLNLFKTLKPIPTASIFFLFYIKKFLLVAAYKDYPF